MSARENRVEKIAAIFIDPSGALCVTPRESTFPFVYRAASRVTWNASGYLCVPASDDHAAAYACIIDTVREEYGCTLTIDNATTWKNISATLQAKLEHAHA